MQNVDMNDYYGEITAYSDYVRIDGQSGRTTTGYLPLITTIPQGAHFKINGRFTHNDGNGRLPVYIAYLENNALITIATVQVSGGSANSYNFEFDSPSNINGIYFVLDDDEGADLTVFATTIEVLDVDYTAILYSAVENAKAQINKNYLPNNPGYEAIYRLGYAKGQTDGNAALTSMDYIQSAFVTLGEILTIEIFPNVPIGAFFMLPLMVSLIFFVVKLTKGGS